MVVQRSSINTADNREQCSLPKILFKEGCVETFEAQISRRTAVFRGSGNKSSVRFWGRVMNKLLLESVLQGVTRCRQIRDMDIKCCIDFVLLDKRQSQRTKMNKSIALLSKLVIFMKSRFVFLIKSKKRGISKLKFNNTMRLQNSSCFRL